MDSHSASEEQSASTAEVAESAYIPKTLSESEIEEINEMGVRLIGSGFYGMRLFEGLGFKSFLENLNPNYPIPPRKTLSKVILPRMYEKTKEKIKIKLAKAATVSISIDNWVSIEDLGHVSITAHYIDQETNEFSSVMTGCVLFDPDCPADGLKENFQEKLVEWGLEHKIVAIVSDGADGNIVEVIKEAEWNIIKCFAKTLSLIIQTSMSKIDDTLSKVRKLIEFFYWNGDSGKKLEEIQRQMNMKPIQLDDDFPNFWISTYEMLKKVQKAKNPILTALTQLENELSISQDDWHIIEKVIAILKIYHQVTKEIREDGYMLASKYIVYCKLINNLLEKFPRDTATAVNEFIEMLKAQMKEHFGDVEKNVLLSEATVLDPRFKNFGFRHHENFENTIGALKIKLSDLAKRESEEQMSEDNNLQTDIEDNSTSLELEKYLLEPVLNRKEKNPMKWWKENRVKYPNVYNYMVNRLNISGTSVPGSQIYTEDGLDLTERRRHETSSKLSMLMVVGFNK